MSNLETGLNSWSEEVLNESKQNSNFENPVSKLLNECFNDECVKTPNGESAISNCDEIHRFVYECLEVINTVVMRCSNDLKVLNIITGTSRIKQAKKLLRHMMITIQNCLCTSPTVVRMLSSEFQQQYERFVFNLLDYLITEVINLLKSAILNLHSTSKSQNSHVTIPKIKSKYDKVGFDQHNQHWKKSECLESMKPVPDPQTPQPSASKSMGNTDIETQTSSARILPQAVPSPQELQPLASASTESSPFMIGSTSSVKTGFPKSASSAQPTASQETTHENSNLSGTPTNVHCSKDGGQSLCYDCTCSRRIEARFDEFDQKYSRVVEEIKSLVKQGSIPVYCETNENEYEPQRPTNEPGRTLEESSSARKPCCSNGNQMGMGESSGFKHQSGFGREKCSNLIQNADVANSKVSSHIVQMLAAEDIGTVINTQLFSTEPNTVDSIGFDEEQHVTEQAGFPVNSKRTVEIKRILEANKIGSDAQSGQVKQQQQLTRIECEEIHETGNESIACYSTVDRPRFTVARDNHSVRLIQKHSIGGKGPDNNKILNCQNNPENQLSVSPQFCQVNDKDFKIGQKDKFTGNEATHGSRNSSIPQHDVENLEIMKTENYLKAEENNSAGILIDGTSSEEIPGTDSTVSMSSECQSFIDSWHGGHSDEIKAISSKSCGSSLFNPEVLNRVIYSSAKAKGRSGSTATSPFIPVPQGVLSRPYSLFDVDVEETKREEHLGKNHQESSPFTVSKARRKVHKSEESLKWYERFNSQLSNIRDPSSTSSCWKEEHGEKPNRQVSISSASSLCHTQLGYMVLLGESTSDEKRTSRSESSHRVAEPDHVRNQNHPTKWNAKTQTAGPRKFNRTDISPREEEKMARYLGLKSFGQFHTVSDWFEPNVEKDFILPDDGVADQFSVSQLDELLAPALDNDPLNPDIFDDLITHESAPAFSPSSWAKLVVHRLGWIPQNCFGISPFAYMPSLASQIQFFLAQPSSCTTSKACQGNLPAPDSGAKLPPPPAPSPKPVIVVDAFSVTEEDKWVLDNEQKLLNCAPTASPSPSEASTVSRNNWEKNSKRDSGLESGDVSDASESPSDKKCPPNAQNVICIDDEPGLSKKSQSEASKKKLNLSEYRNRMKVAQFPGPIKTGTLVEELLSKQIASCSPKTDAVEEKHLLRPNLEADPSRGPATSDEAPGTGVAPGRGQEALIRGSPPATATLTGRQTIGPVGNTMNTITLSVKSRSRSDVSFMSAVSTKELPKFSFGSVSNVLDISSTSVSTLGSEDSMAPLSTYSPFHQSRPNEDFDSLFRAVQQKILR
ncbi:unnamed protein product, partial [Nesidiocoris tenuis]